MTEKALTGTYHKSGHRGINPLLLLRCCTGHLQFGSAKLSLLLQLGDGNHVLWEELQLQAQVLQRCTALCMLHQDLGDKSKKLLTASALRFAVPRRVPHSAIKVLQCRHG